MARRRALLALPAGLILAAGCASSPPRVAKPLPAEAREVLERAGGRWGVHVRDLGSGETFEMAAEESFHAASTMKLLVLAKVFRDVEDGRYRLEDALPVIDLFPSALGGWFLTRGEDPAVTAALGRTLPVKVLLRAMIVTSDNLATNILIEKAGGPAAITRHARSLKLHGTTVARYIEDGAAFAAGISSRARPRDLGMLLEALWREELVSAPASRAMLDLLASTRPAFLGARLPPGSRAAHKTGAIRSVRHDAGIITGPRGQALVVCILGDRLDDEEAAEEAIARAAEALHRQAEALQRPAEALHRPAEYR